MTRYNTYNTDIEKNPFFNVDLNPEISVSAIKEINNNYLGCVITKRDPFLCEIFTINPSYGSYNIYNNILLSCDVHKMFSNYMMSIDSDGKVKILDTILENDKYVDYHKYNNLKTNLPKQTIILFDDHYGKFLEKNKKPKNKGGRPSKKIKYAVERQNILDKIKSILEIDKNKMFYVYDLYYDTEKRDKILFLKDDISKYFSSKDKSIYKNKRQITNEPVMQNTKPELCLVKLVLDEMDIEYHYTRKRINRNNENLVSGCYLFTV